MDDKYYMIRARLLWGERIAIAALVAAIIVVCVAAVRYGIAY